MFLSAKAGAQDFQRDDVGELGVFGAVDFAHAAAAHQFDQAKASVVEEFTGPELSGRRLVRRERGSFQEISQALVLFEQMEHGVCQRGMVGTALPHERGSVGWRQVQSRREDFVRKLNAVRRLGFHRWRSAGGFWRPANRGAQCAPRSPGRQPILPR